MSQYQHLLFIGYVLHLIIACSSVRQAEIKCEKNATGYYVCTNTTVPVQSRDCCYDYELDYYYCCLHFQLRSQSYVNRFIGLIVVAVVIITLICLLCIFFERCPGRWYLKKCMQQRESTNDASEE